MDRRFLVLAETRMPSLASRAMGLGLRNLPEQWQVKHGYRPLVAETFTYIESFEGTCSKNLNLNGNLAVLRCALIALKTRRAKHLSWPAIFELSGLRRAIPYDLTCNNAFN